MKKTNGQQASLLGVDGPPRRAEPPAPLAAPKTAILVTNHLNLMYMLAAGLLMPPSGFGDKHYRDTLEAFPGWLPLFLGRGGKVARAPEAAIAESTAEATHLQPVILEVDLTGFQGPVHAFGEGGWVPRQLEEGVGRSDWLLLVPEPLPVSRIRSILFRSAAEKREVESAAAERRNVPLAAFTSKSAKPRFQDDASLVWPPPDGPAERRVTLPAAQAAGGVMAALQQMANAGDLSVGACRAAFDPSSEPPDDSLLRELPAWIQESGGAEAEEPPGTGRALFWGAVQQLVECRGEPGGRRPEDVLISYLRKSSERMGAEIQVRAAALVSTLDALGGGLGGASISEMLNEHRRPLARAAILFLLRQNTQELLELIEEYPRLEERDRLAAGILFGVRDGWLKLPVALRGPRESITAVTHRMAVLAHRLDESGFDLGEAPPRVQPLRELFAGPETWEAKRERAAERLAWDMKWSCVRTRVSLGKGTYEFRIEGGSAHIDFDGEPKVVTQVDRARFFEYLARDRVAPRVEEAVRNELGV